MVKDVLLAPFSFFSVVVLLAYNHRTYNKMASVPAVHKTEGLGSLSRVVSTDVYVDNHAGLSAMLSSGESPGAFYLAELASVVCRRVDKSQVKLIFLIICRV